MNRKSKIVCASVACIALLTGIFGTGVNAARSKDSPMSEETAKVLTAPQEKIESERGNENTDKMVYVFAKADGSTKKVVASDWIKDEAGDQYTKYTADNTLPVEMRVSYTLDGQTITPDELAGKSGRVAIRYDFENKKTAAVTVNGSEKEVNVPFAAVTAVILDNDVFSDVTVTGGKLINDGDRCMVVGISFPGLRDNFDVSKDAVDLPDHLEISGQAKDFEILNTMTLITNEVFRGIDDEYLGNLSGLQNAAGKMSEAMSQMMDGSVQLQSGLATLKEKTGELSGGAAQLATGASQLNTGAAQLQSGLAQLSSNSVALNGGAAQVFDTLLAQTTAQINQQLTAAGQEEIPALTKDNYAAVLNGLIDSMTEGTVREQAEAQARELIRTQAAAQTEEIRKGVVLMSVIQQQIPSDQMAALGITSPETFMQAVTEGKIQPETAQAIQEAVAQTLTAYAADQLPAETKAQIDAAVSTVTDGIVEKELHTNPEVQAKIEQAIAAANVGAGAISSAKSGLDSYAEFYNGVLAYTAGVDSANTGAAALAEGAAALQGGTAALQSNMPVLTNGVSQLYDGSTQLANGLSQFNTEAVQRLVDAMDGDMEGLADGLCATLDAAETYTGLSGNADENSCVKFIYRTDAIG